MDCVNKDGLEKFRDNHYVRKINSNRFKKFEDVLDAMSFASCRKDASKVIRVQMKWAPRSEIIY